MPRPVSEICASFRKHLLENEGFQKLDDLYPVRPDRVKISDYYRAEPPLIIEEKDFDQAELAPLQKFMVVAVAMKAKYHPTATYLSEMRPELWFHADRDAFRRVERVAASKFESAFKQANRQIRATRRVLQKDLEGVILITNQNAGYFPLSAAHWFLSRKLLKKNENGYRFATINGYLYLQRVKDMPYVDGEDFYAVMARNSAGPLHGQLTAILKSWPDNKQKGVVGDFFSMPDN